MKLAEKLNSMHEKKEIPFWTPEWEKLEGELVMRIRGSKFFAIPDNGKKSAKRFIISDDKSRKEITQVKKSEVNQALIKRAKEEGVKPTGFLE